MMIGPAKTQPSSHENMENSTIAENSLAAESHAKTVQEEAGKEVEPSPNYVQPSTTPSLDGAVTPVAIPSTTADNLDEPQLTGDASSELSANVTLATYDEHWYAELARTFRGSIPRKSTLAFGMRNLLVFTGADAIDHLLTILRAQDSLIAWDRQLASDILRLLANDLWLLIPCGIQQRRGWTLKKGVKLSDCARQLARTSISIFDDDRNLYRLTKDALMLQDISSDCFDDFVQWFTNPQCGIRRKSGRVGLRSYTFEDGVFSERTFYEWLEVHIGASSVKEKESIRRLLLDRQVMSKLALVSCFQLNAKANAARLVSVD